MATNDFIPFAPGPGANVLSQSAYASLSARTTGFLSGVAQSAAVNKAVRQGANMGSVLAQTISDLSGVDSIDDGTTTAMVANLKAVIAGLAGIKFVTVPYTLIASDAGKLIVASGVGAVSYPSGIFPAGSMITISAQFNTDVITLTPPSGGAFSYGGSAKPSINLGNNENASLISQGISNPIPIVYAGGNRSSDDFLFSLGSNGYIKHPSGLFIQWGVTTTSASADVVVTFPRVFATACYTAYGNINSTSQGYVASVNNLTVSGMNLSTYSAASTRAAASTNWLAFGQ